LVEQLTLNQRVVGSSPTAPTIPSGNDVASGVWAPLAARMVDNDVLRRLAGALPEVTVTPDGSSLRIEIGGKGVAWPYRARSAPKKPRVIIDGVIAIRCAMARKELLVEADPDTFFDDDHYRGYPAVLVRLASADEGQVASLLLEGWKLQASKTLAKRHFPDG
jgi:hypothetical protein